MATHTRIIVLGADEKGSTSALGSAEVALVARADLGSSVWPHADLASTHSFQGGHFEPNAPEADPENGEFLLVVQAKGKSPLVQRLTFQKKREVVRAEGGWGKKGPTETAATVSIVNVGLAKKPDDGELPRQSVITATLHPIQFVISITTPYTDLKKKTIDANYRSFARGRFDFLLDQGRLNPGAIGRTIDCRKRETEIFVKAQHRDANSNVTVGVIPQADPKVDGSIVDFYALIDSIGKSDPGSVIESIVWSHAWHQGPILFNTNDSQEHLVDRDPLDTDGRPKDWHAQGIVAQRFPDLGKAYAKDGVFRIAGCSHMVNVVREAEKAIERLRAGASRTSFYEAALPTGWVRTTLDHTKRNIAQFSQAKDFARFSEDGDGAGLCTYLGRAAQALTPTVMGAPAGCEGNMGHMSSSTGHALPTMMIVQKPFRNEQGEVIGGLENEILVDYYRREFGSSFEQDELNYMNYDKLLTAPVPDPGWSTERSLSAASGETGVMLRVASSFIAFRLKKFGSFERPKAHTEGTKKGHLFVAKRCAPDRIDRRIFPDGVTLRILRLVAKAPITDKPLEDDVALFVTEAGEVLLRVRAAKTTDFVPFTGTLATFDVLTKVSVPGAPLSGDLLEKVPLKCHW
ncbi:MAG TPA: hypothetical protein VLC09_13050 [Polyangiaceae bacterium]|nr:hypothetical protein [Polyangiaceae bacterium]